MNRKEVYASPGIEIIPVPGENILQNASGDGSGGNTQHPELDPENPWVP